MKLDGQYPDYFENLPGSVITLEDVINNNEANDAEGDRVVLLGTALDGPKLEPVNVSNYNDGEELFAPYYNGADQANGATLTRGLRNILDAGADNVDLMRISGETAEGSIPLYDAIEKITKETKEFHGDALGNLETEIDLLLGVSSDERDKLLVDEVTVYANGTQLSTRDYQVDNTNGKVKVENGVTDSGAKLEIDYQVIHINLDDIGYSLNSEVLEATTANEKIFTLSNPKIPNAGLEKVIAYEHTTDDSTTGAELKEFTILPQKPADETDTADDEVWVEDEENGEIKFSASPKNLLGEDLDIKVTYNYNDVEMEIVECTSVVSGREFLTANDNLVKGSEMVYVENLDGTLSKLTYVEDFDNVSDPSGTYMIDHEVGVVSTYNKVDVEAGENLLMAYEYQDMESSEEELTATATSQSQIIELSHYANPGKPLKILAGGEVVDKEGYETNYYTSKGRTVITVEPGYMSYGEPVEVVYSYDDIQKVAPEIGVKGYYPGEIYNDVQIYIEDLFYEKQVSIEVEANDVTLQVTNEETVNGQQFVFPPDKRNLVDTRDSRFDTKLEIVDDTGATVEELTKGTVADNDDYEVFWDDGYILLNKSLYDAHLLDDTGDRNNNELVATQFKYIEYYDEAKYSIEQNVALERESPTEFKFPHNYIVPEMETIDDNGDITTEHQIVLAIHKEDGSRDLLDSDDYSINYAKGSIELSSLKAVDSTSVLIAEKYDHYNISGKKVIIEKPDEKVTQRTNEPLEFTIGDGIHTVGDLMEAISNHDRNNVVEFDIDSDLYVKDAMEIKTPDQKIFEDGSLNYAKVTLRGGSNEINLSKEELYKKLGGIEGEDGTKVEYGAYDILLQYEPADLIVPLGVYADDGLLADYKSFANQLAQFCAKCFYTSNELKGMIGLKPLENPTRVNVIERTKRLRKLQTKFFLHDEQGNVVLNKQGNPVDIGKFVSIVCHDLVDEDPNLAMPRIKNGVTEYAGVASMLNTGNAPTNEVLPKKLAYTYSKEQMNYLSGNSLVTFKNDGVTPKITDGVTCAIDGSGWTRYMTTDIVFEAMDEIRAIFDDYIGDGNKLEKRNSLESQIRRALKDNDSIIDFDFTLRMNPQDQLMGRMLIQLELVPEGELQKITTTVSINAQL